MCVQSAELRLDKAPAIHHRPGLPGSPGAEPTHFFLLTGALGGEELMQSLTVALLLSTSPSTEDGQMSWPSNYIFKMA